MSELLDHVTTLPDQLNCNQCNAYRGEKPQNLAKHIALVHSMLDLFLQNHNLVQAKRKEVMARPKKIVIGDTCPGKIIHHSFSFTKVFSLYKIKKPCNSKHKSIFVFSSLSGKDIKTG